jgi:hypothetical protein
MYASTFLHLPAFPTSLGQTGQKQTFHWKFPEQSTRNGKAMAWYVSNSLWVLLVSFTHGERIGFQSNVRPRQKHQLARFCYGVHIKNRPGYIQHSIIPFSLTSSHLGSNKRFRWAQTNPCKHNIVSDWPFIAIPHQESGYRLKVGGVREYMVLEYEIGEHRHAF